MNTPLGLRNGVLEAAVSRPLEHRSFPAQVRFVASWPYVCALSTPPPPLFFLAHQLEKKTPKNQDFLLQIVNTGISVPSCLMSTHAVNMSQRRPSATHSGPTRCPSVSTSLISSPRCAQLMLNSPCSWPPSNNPCAAPSSSTTYTMGHGTS